MGRTYGYIRVSTEDQKLDMQVDAMRAAGCDSVFKDFGVSGRKHKRPGLDKLLEALRPGDVVIVWKLSRLGRSFVHLAQLLDHFERHGIKFRSLTEPFDTTTAAGRAQMGMHVVWAAFISDMISEGTIAGMAAAKRRGKHVGRPRALTPDQVFDAFCRIADGESVAATAHHFNVHPDTMKRALTRHRAEATLTLFDWGRSRDDEPPRPS